MITHLPISFFLSFFLFLSFSLSHIKGIMDMFYKRCLKTQLLFLWIWGGGQGDFVVLEGCCGFEYLSMKNMM